MMADRIFRAEDGTELHEEDITICVGICLGYVPTVHEGTAAGRLRAALAPKTCGAVLWAVEAGGAGYVCVLPRGHHPYTLHPAEDGTRVVACNYPVGDGRACCKYADDPIHSPGHMTDQSTWSEA
jgi:hypothetical protein